MTKYNYNVLNVYVLNLRKTQKAKHHEMFAISV